MMTLTQRHAEVVELDRLATRAQRVASDAAIGEGDVSWDDAYRAAQVATTALLTALASFSVAELKAGPAGRIMLRRVAAR